MQSQLSPIGRFERLLLATDGTRCSADAEGVAMTMAQQWGATLLIASVVITSPIAEEVAFDLAENAQDDVQILLERLHADARARGIAVETVLLSGRDPLERIVDAAEAHRADLIVMGRHEKGRAC